MKRELNYDNPQVIHVVSEPGDATRYSYGLVRQDQFNRWAVIPEDCTMALPRVIEDWEAADYYAAIYGKDLYEAATILGERADQHKCNPHTLREIVTAIHEVQE